MPDQKNDDFEVPHVPIGSTKLVKTDNYQQDNIPIFWGPNQITSGGTYSEPSGFRAEILRIPRVGRFIHASQNEYETEDYANDGGGGGPTDYYIITEIRDHIPPFIHDFIIVYGVVGGMPFTPGLFNTTQYILDPSGALVNVGAMLSVGMKWQESGPRFEYSVNGHSGPGWYTSNTGLKVNFF